VSGDQSVTGRLANEELLRLATMAEPVATSDLRNSLECELHGLLAVNTFDITLSDGSTWRFYDGQLNAICTRGGRAQAAALANYFHSLLDKYYPKRPAP